MQNAATWRSMGGVLVLAIAGAASGETLAWDGGAKDREFASAANWEGDNDLHKKKDYALTGGRINRSVDSRVGTLTINGGATLNITKGEHVSLLPGKKAADLYFHGSGGKVNQSGGLHQVGHLLSIGSGDRKQGGFYNLTGGTLTASRATGARLGQSYGAPDFASLEIGDDANRNTAKFEISEKAVLQTRGGVIVGQTGVFNVVGSKATVEIGSWRNLDGGWTQLKGGILHFEIDWHGCSPIFVDDTDDQPGVDIDFQRGSKLELEFALGTPVRQGSWTIFKAENTVFDDQTLAGLSLTRDTRTASNDSSEGWSFTYGNVDGDGVIIATYDYFNQSELVLVEPQ